MKSSLLFAVALTVVATPALAASPFDGTWKTDLTASKFSQKPDVYLLKGGSYSCKSCTPPVTVPADGAFHPVKGEDYFDAMAVKVGSPSMVTVTLRKGEKIIAVNDMAVSADGKTMGGKSTRTNPVTGVEGSSTATWTRVAPAAAGAHLISGSWRISSADSVSDTAGTQTLKVEGDALTLTTPTGEGYTATFGGPAVVQGNDIAKTMITLKKVSDHRIIETDTRDGKVVLTYDMTVSSDGRTMTMVMVNKEAGTTDNIVLKKQ